MKFTIILFILIFISLFSSCKDDINSPAPSTSEFSVKISVKNLSGIPVAGLRIKAFNHIPDNYPQIKGDLKGDIQKIFGGTSLNNKGNQSNLPAVFKLYQNYPNPFNPTTRISYSLAADSKIFLAILDMDNKLVSTLVNGETQSAGSHSVDWSANWEIPNRVHKYRLTAQDTTSGTVLFRDSLYAVFYTSDEPQIPPIGWTSGSGIYETGDSLLFPNVLSLHVFARTDEFGNDIGTFTIMDSVTIFLRDTVTNKSMEFGRVVTKSANDIQLVWDPAQTKP